MAFLDAVAPKSPTPRVIIKKLTIDNVTIPIDGLGDSRILCSDLSDAPSGMSEPVVIGVESSKHKSSVKLTSDYSTGGGSSTVEASFADFDLAGLQKSLKGDNPVVFNGGRASATVKGNMTREWTDLSLALNIKDLKAKATGSIGSLDPKIASEAMKVLNELKMTVRIVGPTGSPRLVIDSKAFGQSLREALTKAGKDELARRAGDLLGGALPEGVPGIGGKGSSGGDALNPIKGLLGGY